MNKRDSWLYQDCDSLSKDHNHNLSTTNHSYWRSFLRSLGILHHLPPHFLRLGPHHHWNQNAYLLLAYCFFFFDYVFFALLEARAAGIVYFLFLLGGEHFATFPASKFVFVCLVMLVHLSFFDRLENAAWKATRALKLLLQKYLTFFLVFCFVSNTLLPMIEGFFAIFKATVECCFVHLHVLNIK